MLDGLSVKIIRNQESLMSNTAIADHTIADHTIFSDRHAAALLDGSGSVEWLSRATSLLRAG